jgi:glycosyltransferase involved in cell wall biosynthesis
MNVLVVHNQYKGGPGGEDRVVDLETTLLARNGHRVLRYTVDNHDVERVGRVALACRTLWNHAVYRDIRRVIAQERVSVVHVHNTLPLISPAVYYAARAEGVPVVQTLHNYRLICSNAVCVRGGNRCTACVGAAVPWRAVRHACYRGSRAASAAVAGLVLFHRTLHTWQRRVDAYIAPTEFARRMFISGGLPAERIVVKPHFVDPDPGAGSGRGGYALFVGRLSVEKGVRTLLDAWTELGSRVPLTIVGDGPLAPDVASAATRLEGVRWLGRQSHADVRRLMRDAAFVVAPSLAYETFGQVIIEAFAAGTPVVASADGAAAELVERARTGVLVRPADVRDLVAKVEWLLAHQCFGDSMRRAARYTYEERFTAQANYRLTMEIYNEVILRAARQPTAGWVAGQEAAR